MKLGAWMMMLTGMITFLTLVGVPTGLTSILNTLGINIANGAFVSADTTLSSFYTTVIAALALASAGSIIIGLFAKGYDVSLIILTPVIAITGLFIGLFWSTIKYIMEVPGSQSWMVGIATIIFASIGTAFLLSAMDYFAGR
jgi:hypothetical protein